jgi:hypothetical protein
LSLSTKGKTANVERDALQAGGFLGAVPAQLIFKQGNARGNLLLLYSPKERLDARGSAKAPPSKGGKCLSRSAMSGNNLPPFRRHE